MPAQKEDQPALESIEQRHAHYTYELANAEEWLLEARAHLVEAKLRQEVAIQELHLDELDCLTDEWPASIGNDPLQEMLVLGVEEAAIDAAHAATDLGYAQKRAALMKKVVKEFDTALKRARADALKHRAAKAG